MSNEEIELQPAELLKAISSNLDRMFFGVPKSEAKSCFRDLRNGNAVAFLEIGSADHGEVYCDLMLDHSDFVGRLNFTQFRNALAMHLQKIAGKIESKEDMNIFTNKETNDMIFHIPGIIENQGTVNVLVTGIEQRLAGKLTVKLMFIDPKNYSMKS